MTSTAFTFGILGTDGGKPIVSASFTVSSSAEERAEAQAVVTRSGGDYEIALRSIVMANARVRLAQGGAEECKLYPIT